MRVPISRIDPTLPLPEYASAGATAFDLYTRVDVTVNAHDYARIPSNVIVGIPKGFTLIVSLRSSTPQRTGLIAPHGIGVVDQDYRGPNDEIQILVYNHSDGEIRISRGERIAQGLLLPVERVDWEERDRVSAVSRGGFGSTD